jgi:hypothetical protein
MLEHKVVETKPTPIQLIQIPAVDISSFVVDNLASGTYYFAMSSYTTAGVESDLSAIVSKTF